VWLGGLLVIDQHGKPLEFHCTTPIEVNRAQQILFGDSLEQQICVATIGAALVAKLKQPTDLLLVGQELLADLAPLIDMPVVVLGSQRETPPAEPQQGELWVAGYECHVQNANIHVANLLEQLAATVDLAEPLERIVEAIREAHGLEPSQSPPEPSADAA
jgi:hypothetical protein